MTFEVVNNTLEQWSTEYKGAPFHASLCDPPYDLGFMGKEWDKSANFKLWGQAMLPHLYPGAIVLMFGGTRTWHRLAYGMEDAGFEIWDTLMWLYGSGFPKGQAIKADGFEGYKTTALKPAWEPIVCFKKPLEGTYAENVSEHGSGALNVDGARIPLSGIEEHSTPAKSGLGRKGIYGSSTVEYIEGKDLVRYDSKGRFPANIILDEDAANLLDEQSGELKSGTAVGGLHRRSNKTGNCYGKWEGERNEGDVCYGDAGGASRFFYCAKVAKSERGVNNTHPTLKPLALTEYLARLILPPASIGERRLLVPFSGSGSEMIGALKAGWDTVVGIEQDKHYCEIAEQRLQPGIIGL